MAAFVFIDSRVAGIGTLTRRLESDIRAVLLSPDADGIRQIAGALKG